ncbi:hypothetical protein Bca4012_079182 [Brassica carinata]
MYGGGAFLLQTTNSPSSESNRKSAGPFDALICVGQFFPDSLELLDEFLDYVEGRAQVLIPTYFTGDYGVPAPKSYPRPRRKLRIKGLRWTGSWWHTSCLSVSYLSGTESSDGQFGKYSQDDVDALRALADDSGVVDFLFTNEWPVGVTNRAAESDIPTEVSDSSCCDSNVSELVKEVKPRYPIAGSMGGVLCP